MESPRADPGPPSPAHLGELVTCLWRARGLVLLSALGGLALGLLAVVLTPPSFAAHATILIEQENPSGLLGDLAMLASLSSSPATASELSVLESRTLAEQVLAEGADEQGRWDPRDERRLGLTTLVQDESLRLPALLQRALFDPPPPEVPLVLPERELFARVTEATPLAPRELELEFLARDRLRISTAGLRERFGLGDRAPEELPYAPRTPLPYRGLTLELETTGDCSGATFHLQFLPRHEALERLLERIQVRETALNSGVIEVAMEDSDPRRVARTVNALCRNYMDSLAARGQRRASKTVEYVQGLLDEEFARFAEAQDEVMHLQQDAPELISPESSATTIIEQMAALEVERVQLEISRRAFGEIVTALEAGDAGALAQIDSTLNVGVLVDPVTNGLLAELARLEAQAGSLGADLVDAHPLVLKNRAATRALLEKTHEQLQSRLAGLGSRAVQLDEVRDELRQRLSALPEGLRSLAETRVELGIHRELVPYLIKSLQGAEITRQSAETLAETVDPAAPASELAAPDVPRTLLLGLLLGMCAGLTGAFLREPKRGRIHSAPELAGATAAEFSIALARLDARALVLAGASTGPDAEAIRALRGALRALPLAPTPERRGRIIGVSAVPSDAAGATLAAELALAFAGEGRRTLLVEADLRRPELAAPLGWKSGAGLAGHLEQGTNWRELLQRPPQGNIDVLVAGTARVAPGDLLAREAMERFLSEASAAYEVVLLALPGALGAPEVATLARACDVLCLVHLRRSLARQRVAAVAESLRAAGTRALAAVFVTKS